MCWRDFFLPFFLQSQQSNEHASKIVNMKMRKAVSRGSALLEEFTTCQFGAGDGPLLRVLAITVWLRHLIVYCGAVLPRACNLKSIVVLLYFRFQKQTIFAHFYVHFMYSSLRILKLILCNLFRINYIFRYAYIWRDWLKFFILKSIFFFYLI